MLESALDLQKLFMCDDQAEFFKELTADDGVGDPGFVFQADEDMSFGLVGAQVGLSGIPVRFLERLANHKELLSLALRLACE